MFYTPFIDPSQPLFVWSMILQPRLQGALSNVGRAGSEEESALVRGTLNPGEEHLSLISDKLILLYNVLNTLNPHTAFLDSDAV